MWTASFTHSDPQQFRDL